MRAERRTVRAAAASITLFTVVAFALALPWYARAYASSANPVFPEMYGVFGAKPDTRWSEGTQQALGRFNAKFGMGRTPRAIVGLPWSATTHAARFGGSFGPLFLVLIPLSTAGAGHRRLVPIAAGCGAYAAVWALPLGDFQLRFLVPLVSFLR